MRSARVRRRRAVDSFVFLRAVEYILERTGGAKVGGPPGSAKAQPVDPATASSSQPHETVERLRRRRVITVGASTRVKSTSTDPVGATIPSACGTRHGQSSIRRDLRAPMPSPIVVDGHRQRNRPPCVRRPTEARSACWRRHQRASRSQLIRLPRAARRRVLHCALWPSCRGAHEIEQEPSSLRGGPPHRAMKSRCMHRAESMSARRAGQVPPGRRELRRVDHAALVRISATARRCPAPRAIGEWSPRAPWPRSRAAPDLTQLRPARPLCGEVSGCQSFVRSFGVEAPGRVERGSLRSSSGLECDLAKRMVGASRRRRLDTGHAPPTSRRCERTCGCTTCAPRRQPTDSSRPCSMRDVVVSTICIEEVIAAGFRNFGADVAVEQQGASRRSRHSECGTALASPHPLAATVFPIVLAVVHAHGRSSTPSAPEPGDSLADALSRPRRGARRGAGRPDRSVARTRGSGSPSRRAGPVRRRRRPATTDRCGRSRRS